MVLPELVSTQPRSLCPSPLKSPAKNAAVDGSPVSTGAPMPIPVDRATCQLPVPLVVKRSRRPSLSQSTLTIGCVVGIEVSKLKAYVLLQGERYTAQFVGAGPEPSGAMTSVQPSPFQSTVVTETSSRVKVSCAPDTKPVPDETSSTHSQ